jgi:hypothetical protein
LMVVVNTLSAPLPWMAMHHENSPRLQFHSKREWVPSTSPSTDHQHSVFGNIDVSARGYAACELGYVPRRFLVG